MIGTSQRLEHCASAQPHGRPQLDATMCANRPRSLKYQFRTDPYQIGITASPPTNWSTRAAHGSFFQVRVQASVPQGRRRVRNRLPPSQHAAALTAEVDCSQLSNRRIHSPSSSNLKQQLSVHPRAWPQEECARAGHLSVECERSQVRPVRKNTVSPRVTNSQPQEEHCDEEP